MNSMQITKPKILIVDDKPANLIALRTILSEVTAEVIDASSGMDALTLALEHKLALILLDVQMPVMTGFEVAEILHGATQTRNIPIIFLTAAYKRNQDTTRGYSSGAVDYLLKPLDEHVLLAKVRIFLDLFEKNQEFEMMTRRLQERNGQLEREIDQRKKLESELLKSRDVATAANRAKSAFLASMSHEIRTPMNAIIGMADLWNENMTAVDQRESMHIIKESGNALLTLINDILDLAKIESGEVKIHEESFLPRELVASIFNIMRVSAVEKKGLRFVKNVDANVPDAVVADPIRIRQIMINLVGNAIKFTDSGSIEISLKAELNDDGKTMLIFSVMDTGIGIPQEKMDAVFGAFVQAEETTYQRFGGTGLGLSICKKFINLMGGSITAESTVGLGSRFSVAIPVVAVGGEHPGVSQIGKGAWGENDVGLIDLEGANSPGVPSAGFPPDTQILVAEDDPVNQLVIFKMLKRLGIKPDLVQNGLELLAFAGRKHYDLIFTDIQMPQMDGMESVRILRQREKEGDSDRRVPIVALTAHALEEERESFLCCGMDDYLCKPLRGRELEAMLHRWLDKSHEILNKKKHKDKEGFMELSATIANALEELHEDLGDDFSAIVTANLLAMSEGIQKIRKVILEENSQGLHQWAHRMKSSCRLLGAVEAGFLAERLELIGRSETTAGAGDLADRLEVEALMADRIVRGILAQHRA
ncbi:MAG: response regulator [Magnetococcales bacterium]|nr:response regulator [Magnetococcales bacterium]